MRLKKDGTPWAMDLPAQAFQQDGWRGTYAETLTYYRRIVEHARGDLLHREADYAKHFDGWLLLNAVVALQELEKYLKTFNAEEKQSDI